MKKLIFAVLLIPALLAHATEKNKNIIALEKLMFYTVVEDKAREQLGEHYPEYAAWLSDSDVLLLLNIIATTDKAVIVKFWAEWCEPCNRFAPVVQEVAEAYSGEVIIIEVNVDNAPSMRHIFEIDALPTLIYFKNGKQVDRTNSISKATLLNKIKALVTQESSGAHV